VSGGTDVRTASLAVSLAGLPAADPDAVALAQALDPQIQEIATLAEQCAFFSRIAGLTSGQCDEVARWFKLVELEGWALADVARKRAVLAEMVNIYRRRGTRWALERVLGILETVLTVWDGGGTVWDGGSTVWDERDGMYTVEEWWERTPPDPACTYRIDATIEHHGLTLDEIRHLGQVLEAYVPARAHLYELSETITLSSGLLIAGYPEIGIDVEVYA
jgi:hypothetical protein